MFATMLALTLATQGYVPPTYEIPASLLAYNCRYTAFIQNPQSGEQEINYYYSLFGINKADLSKVYFDGEYFRLQDQELWSEISLRSGPIAGTWVVPSKPIGRDGVVALLYIDTQQGTIKSDAKWVYAFRPSGVTVFNSFRVRGTCLRATHFPKPVNRRTGD